MHSLWTAGRSLSLNQIHLLLAGTALAACSILAQTTSQVPSELKISEQHIQMNDATSRLLSTTTEKPSPTLELADTPAGNRRVFTLSGGQFAGDRLRGEVLAQASSDLLLVRADGSFQLDARLVL